MRLPTFILLLLLVACKNAAKEKETRVTDTNSYDITLAPKDSIPAPGPMAVEMNDRLKKEPGSKWIVVDDNSANWAKDQFDYFIAPKRKEQPDYPYITQGDYDGDGKKDIAALVTDSTKTTFTILVLTGAGNTITWDEDIMSNAALSTIPPSEVIGMDGENTKTVKIRNDAINVEFFEQAAFVLYWDGKKFRRLQTGD